MLEWLKEKFSPHRSCFWGLDIFRAAGGTLYLFPSVFARNGGPVYTLPEPTTLTPPYAQDAVGHTILALCEKWKDAEPLDGLPTEMFWMAVPGCRSYRSFQRGHQLIGAHMEGQKLSLRYEPRREDGGYDPMKEDVELCASFDVTSAQLAPRIGRAVWQMFRLAEVLDPLPSANTKADKTKMNDKRR